MALAGCAHEGSSLSDPHPVTVADLQAVLRDEWSRHVFWIRHVVMDNPKGDRRSRDFAEKAVAANARDMAKTLAPFYGDATAGRFRTLLTKHDDMILKTRINPSSPTDSAWVSASSPRSPSS